MPHYKTYKTCKACIHNSMKCKQNVNCFRCSNHKTGGCRCFSVKYGEACPYYTRDSFAARMKELLNIFK